MLVWLNGPFGIGKTVTAHALVERLPQAILYDPEPLGAVLRPMLASVDPVIDFQDLRPWRQLVVDTARVLRQTYACPLVMPMTVLRRDYLEELMDGLHQVDEELHCFRLVAPEPVLRARILNRPDENGPHTWCLEHLAHGVQVMRDPAYGLAIPTEERRPEDVAALILAQLTNSPCLS
jgi:hypothetical protein